MLKGKEYIKTVRRPYPPLFASLQELGMVNEEYFDDLVDRPASINHTLYVEGDIYYSKEEIERVSKVVFENWMQPEKLTYAKKVLKQREQQLLQVAMRNDFDAFCDAYEAYAPAILLVWRAEEPTEKHIRQLLSKKLSEKETNKLLDTLNVPFEDNYHVQEEYDLVQTTDLEKHVKKYEWLKARYGSLDAYTVEEAKERLAEIDKDIFLASYEERKEKVRTAITRAKGILGEHATIVDLMQYIVYYRTQRSDVLNRAQYTFASELKKQADKYNVSYEQLLHVIRTEIPEKIPTTEELDVRIKAHAVVYDEAGLSCVVGQKLEEIQKLLHEDLGDVSELSGAIAYKGIVTGTVRLVFDTEDFDKVEKGSILITSMTNPHMMPIMKKAAAFVTDEGGITCHAAIISREMKKPCIIGTKHATKIFKDGDVVEVDAERGIVKKV